MAEELKQDLVDRKSPGIWPEEPRYMTGRAQVYDRKSPGILPEEPRYITWRAQVYDRKSPGIWRADNLVEIMVAAFGIRMDNLAFSDLVLESTLW